MHPAYSVILFTVASGAGYGLLIWLALEAAFGAIARETRLGFVGMAIALGLITVGLLSSTLHLGRPERAWRAFSQWRTSWLSREGVLAVATFVPAVLLGLLWVLFEGGPLVVLGLLALLTVVLALATVWSTGMIYQSLPTIRAWCRPVVTPIYVVLALASGAVLLYALLTLFGLPAFGTGVIAILLLAAGALLKLDYWRQIDRAEKTWTAGNATGLGSLGKVRVLEQPHSTANFVMREMGYQVARRHGERLRQLALVSGFLLPIVLLLLALMSGAIGSAVLAVLAVLAMAIGLVTERWLFFAQAQHVVSVFYGQDAA